MAKRQRVVLSSIVFLSCLFSPILFSRSAFAQVVFIADGTLNDYATVNPNDEFRVYLEQDESYCCTVYALNTLSEIGFSTTIRDVDTNNFTGSLRGAVTPRVTVNSATDTDASDNRICYTPTSSTTYIFTFDTAIAGGEDAKVRCERTTLYGGYNTNATPINFLECTNESNASIASVLNARNNSGTFDIADSNLTFAANERQDIDIHTSAGTNTFGTLILTHDGPRGALECSLSRYESDLEFKGTSRLTDDL